MKNWMLLIAVMMSMFTASWAGEPTIDCREGYEPNAEFGTAEARLAADLTSGIWTMEADRLPGQGSQIIFHEFGVADEIIVDADGRMRYERVNWDVDTYNGSLFLVVSHVQEGKTNLYRVTPTCQGIDLTDAGNFERIELTYQGKQTADAQAMAHYLTGTWINNGYPFALASSMDDCGTFQPMHDAFVQYAFWQDGTFVRELGNRGKTIKEKGYWDITEDGQHLLLHVMDLSGDQIIRTDVAKIEQMADGSFTIRQELKNRDGNDMFCTDLQSTTFERWTVAE